MTYTQELISAVKAGDADVVRALIDAGADVNVQNQFNETPLHYAAKAGSAEVVRALIDAGADVNVQKSI